MAVVPNSHLSSRIHNSLKMIPKIIIAAANGFMGRHLVNFLKNRYEVVTLTRQPDPQPGVKNLHWDGVNPGDWVSVLNGVWALLNLAGRSVDCRYHARNRKEILESRLNATQCLGEALSRCEHKPAIWLNAASATIYRHSLLDPMTEEQGEYGHGFSVDVCQQWESAFFSYRHLPIRQVALRTAIVLGQGGGVAVPFRRLVQFGLGGPMAGGQQMFSWIHSTDFCRAVEFILNNKHIEGPCNISAPYPVTNAQFMQAVSSHLNPFVTIPTSRFMLEWGARMIRTETELVLKSRYVIPEKLLSAGFQFEFPDLSTAIPDVFIK